MRVDRVRVVVPVDARVPEHVAPRVLAGLQEFGRRRINARRLHRRDVDEARLRVERHRVPVVTAERRRHDELGFLAPVALGRLDRAPRLHVDVAGPRRRDVLVRRQQLARDAVDDVEEAVLRRLHQHLARFAVDDEVREDDVLRRGVVPVVTRRDLVMPLQAPGVRIEREDRREEQVVAAARRADRARPRRAIAGADVERVEVGVVRHRVPDRAAAAAGPPLAGPGLRGRCHLRALEAVLRDCPARCRSATRACRSSAS